jgi:hypothetical protein
MKDIKYSSNYMYPSLHLAKSLEYKKVTFTLPGWGVKCPVVF